MRIGVSLPNVGVGNTARKAFCESPGSAERLGFDSVWAAHHVLMPYERASEYPVSALRHRDRDDARHAVARPARDALDDRGRDRAREARHQRLRTALPRSRHAGGRSRRARRAERRARHPRCRGGLDARGVRGDRDSVARAGRAHRRAPPGHEDTLDATTRRAFRATSPASTGSCSRPDRTARVDRRSGSAATPTSH